jgi:uncharacterized membrane protein
VPDAAAAAALGRLHPLIVHFPAALLPVAPLFIVLAKAAYWGGRLMHEFGVRSVM